jgi:hypothetical protein
MTFGNCCRYLFLLFFVVALSCENQRSTSPTTQWRFDDNGWVLRADSNTHSYEKFFAIGTWHLPGYVFSSSKEPDSIYEKNALLFKSKSAPFNMVFVTPGQQKDYMADKIHIVNPFSKILHDYLNQISEIPDRKDKDYHRSQLMKKIVNDPAFEEYLKTEITKIVEQLPNDKYLYSHIDEIALGGVSKWAVPPSMGEKITQVLKGIDNDAMVYVDLVGHGKGSTFLFEQRYLQNHDSLPENPPYELVDQGALDCDIPLLGFYQAYNGLPVYQFNNGKYSYRKFDEETLKSIWYENIKLISAAYKNCGDVFGINAHSDFFSLPILAGITVDALKAGLGKGTPIWIYFDGNGYAKPKSMTPESYVKILKCQIYTSVIHGATGILFWNDWRKQPEVFDVLLPVLEELNDNLGILYLPTVEQKADGDLHAMIKKGDGGKKYIIATNTSKTEELEVDFPGMPNMRLLPMGVYISEFR